MRRDAASTPGCAETFLRSATLLQLPFIAAPLPGGMVMFVSQEVRHEDAHEDRWPDLHREASPIILLLSLSPSLALSLIPE